MEYFQESPTTLEHYCSTATVSSAILRFPILDHHDCFKLAPWKAF
jgi:hypothetical protein